MKKKNVLTLLRTTLASLMLVCLGMGFVACKEEENADIPKVVDYGFTQEEISVEQYALVSPETPLVLLDNGESAAVFYEVVNAENDFVQVASGSFIAEEISGYTIKYAFIYNQEQIASKDIKVNVFGSAFSVTAEYTEYIDTGVSQEIQAITPEGAEVSYKVTFGEETIDVVNGVFVAENVGEYLIEITAEKDGKIGRFSYKTFARTPSLQGEVEKFDENWETVRAKSGIKNITEYTQVDSKDTVLKYGEKQGEKLLDRFGQEASFLSYETTGNTADNPGNNYLWMSLNVRNDLSYYKQLAKDGYEYVSMWVYLDAQNYHHTEMKGTPFESLSMYDIVSYHGNISAREEVNYNPVLQPNQWTELRLGLYQGAMGRRANRISLITSYSYYKNGGNFLVIDNSNDPIYDRYGESGKMSVYISDICVVRKIETAMFDIAAEKDFYFADVLNKNGEIYAGTGYTYEAYCNGKPVSADGKLLSSEITEGVNSVFVKVFKDGEFVENRQIDLTVVNTDKALAFTTLDTDHIKGTQFGTTVQGVTTLVNETVGEKTGSFIKITADGENVNYAGVKVKPTVEKEILEAYADGYIEISYYMDFVGVNGGEYTGNVALLDLGYYSENSSATLAYVHQTWQKARIPIKDFLSIYDSYIAGYNNTYHAGKLLYMKNRHGAGTIYIESVTLRSNSLYETGVDFGDLTSRSI